MDLFEICYKTFMKLFTYELSKYQLIYKLYLIAILTQNKNSNILKPSDEFFSS